MFNHYSNKSLYFIKYSVIAIRIRLDLLTLPITIRYVILDT